MASGRDSESRQVAATSGALPNEAALTEIRRLNRRLREAEDQVAALEASTSYRLGHSLVETARSPRKVTRLGRELVRVWRSRAGHGGSRRPAGRHSEVDARASWVGAIRSTPARALLAYSVGGVGQRTRLVVVGLVTDATAATIGPHVELHRIAPQDALAIIERTDPDLVLIETGAFSAGRPWAYTGIPGTTDRETRLLEILDAARALGRPAVLWWSRAAPEPVGIWPLAGRFDLVLDAAGNEGTVPWSPGVQLTRFNNVALDPIRAGGPLFAGAWDERLPADRKGRFDELLQAALRRGLEIAVDAYASGGRASFPVAYQGAIRGRMLPATEAGLYRSHAVVIADPRADLIAADQVGAALACGARVVSLPAPDLDDFPDEACRIVGPGAQETALAGVLAAGPRGQAAIRQVLRLLYDVQAVPVRLSVLAARAGIQIDPLAERRIGVHVGASATRDAASLVDDLLGQVHRPNVVILRDGAEDDLGAVARATLAGAGIGVATSPIEDDATPWIAEWDRMVRHHPQYLHDLAVAAEASNADAVAYVDNGPGALRA